MKLILLFCRFQEVLTLRNLWALGCTVIVSYEHNIASCHSDLWPHIPYWWANKCRAESLIEEFEHRKQHGRPGLEWNWWLITFYLTLYFAHTPLKISCAYFVFQEVSSSQELIWQRTWNTSARTRQSPWRIWWCPRIRRCWAGSRSRLPAPRSAPSISLLGTLSPRASLYQLSLRWMRNYWNGPRDFLPICIY